MTNNRGRGAGRMMLLKRLGIGVLRLLIGIGFTFSLVIGVTLTLLTLCDSPGGNLTLSQTGPHWEWSIPAVTGLGLTLFFWLCWRLLPAVKPTQAFPTIERSFQIPGVVIACGFCGFLLKTFEAIEMGSRLFLHAPGGSEIYFAYYLLGAVCDGLLLGSAWKQQKAKASSKAYSEQWYARK